MKGITNEFVVGVAAAATGTLIALVVEEGARVLVRKGVQLLKRRVASRE